MCGCSCCPWPGGGAAGTFAWQGRLYIRDAPEPGIASARRLYERAGPGLHALSRCSTLPRDAAAPTEQPAAEPGRSGSACKWAGWVVPAAPLPVPVPMSSAHLPAAAGCSPAPRGAGVRRPSRSPGGQSPAAPGPGRRPRAPPALPDVAARGRLRPRVRAPAVPGTAARRPQSRGGRQSPQGAAGPARVTRAGAFEAVRAPP